MRVLVAGAFGFVGGRIAHALHNAGHEVVLGSRESTVSPTWLPKAEVRCMDWESLQSLQQTCKGIDAIVHVAGMNAADSAADPLGALLVNGLWTARLVEAAISERVKRFFYFSTAHVYASPLQGDIDEQSCPSNLHPYASSHLAGEYALLHRLNHRKIAGSSLRLSNSFGAPMTRDSSCWTLLMNDLCRQAVKDRKLVLQSSGEQLRDFVPLSAVCKYVVNLLSLPELSLPKVLNVGSGKTSSVLSMAHMIQACCKNILGYSPTLETGTTREIALPFHYGSKYTTSLGLSPVDLIAETDKLLLFCEKSFSV